MRFVHVAIAAGVLGGVAFSIAGLSSSVPLVSTAQAQAPQQNPLERARTAVETLINRLRGRDMPEGIVKTNGRIEATQVDVAAKYPGRLATVTKDEGDEVTAGEVVATISSPETEAQLRAAQAQVIKAKQALAEAVALIAQRKSDLDFARTDYERGKPLLEHGTITQQTMDQRRNKFEAADAALVATRDRWVESTKSYIRSKRTGFNLAQILNLPNDEAAGGPHAALNKADDTGSTGLHSSVLEVHRVRPRMRARISVAADPRKAGERFDY